MDEQMDVAKATNEAFEELEKQSSNVGIDNEPSISDDVNNSVETEGDNKEPQNLDNEETEPLPISIKKEFEEQWKGIDKELQKELSHRIATDDSVIKRFKAEKEEQNQILASVKPYIKQVAKQDRCSEHEAIRELITFVQNVNDNPDSLAELIGSGIIPRDPITFIKNVAKNLKIDLNNINNINQDPHTKSLQEYYQKQEAIRAARLREEEYNRENTDLHREEEMYSAIDDFSFKHRDFVKQLETNSELNKKFIKLVEIERVANPQIADLDIMEKAYEFLNPLSIKGTPKENPVNKAKRLDVSVKAKSSADEKTPKYQPKNERDAVRHSAELAYEALEG